MTAVAAGVTTITATSGGVSGSATITVSQPPATVTLVVVTAALTNLDEGATGQLTATVRDGAGNVLTGKVVTWASSNQATATVTSSGQVAGIAEGDTVTVTATSEGVSGTAKVVVRSLYFIAKEVAVGAEHTCAVRIIGGTYCWGRRGEGQLGNPSNPGGGTRVITGGTSVFTHVAAGTYHSCGLTSTGVAHCFGLNNGRELGAGSTSTFETLPVAVSGGLVFARLFAGPPSVAALLPTELRIARGRNQPEELGAVGNGNLSGDCAHRCHW